jgi:predicted nucleotidyltransferase
LFRIPDLGTLLPNMGIYKPTGGTSAPTTLADSLFTPVQQRVLGLLFGQPKRRFQSADLIRLVDSGTGATHRVVKRLAGSGLVLESVDGRQTYYQANPDSPVFDELVALIRKTVGLAGPLHDALMPLANRIHAAFVYGSIASGRDRADSDIDLMVIADDLDYPTLFEAVQLAEGQLARSVDCRVMTPSEWQRKRKRADSFVARLLDRPHVFVLGSEDDLR